LPGVEPAKSLWVSASQLSFSEWTSLAMLRPVDSLKLPQLGDLGLQFDQLLEEIE